MTRIIILLLLFAATACSKPLAEGEVSERQIAELGLNPCHRIVINKGKIYYNGQQLKLGTPVQKWVDILGPYDREVSVSGNQYYWDRVGFVLSGTTDRIASFSVDFNLVMDELFDGKYDKSSLSIKKAMLENSCKYFFSGNILVDGAPLGRGSNIKDFVKQAHCQWRTFHLPRFYNCEYREGVDIPTDDFDNNHIWLLGGNQPKNGAAVRDGVEVNITKYKRSLVDKYVMPKDYESPF